MLEYKFMKIRAIFIASALFVCSVAFAQQQSQQPKTPEEQEKEFREMLEKTMEEITRQLKLEDWQEFYVDSIYTHDLNALRAEQKELAASRVENPDLYMKVSDKWTEKIYQSVRRYLTPEQWEKYNKIGAAKAKMDRDRRAGIVTKKKKKK